MLAPRAAATNLPDLTDYQWSEDHCLPTTVVGSDSVILKVLGTWSLSWRAIGLTRRQPGPYKTAVQSGKERG